MSFGDARSSSRSTRVFCHSGWGCAEMVGSDLDWFIPEPAFGQTGLNQLFLIKLLVTSMCLII